MFLHLVSIRLLPHRTGVPSTIQGTFYTSKPSTTHLQKMEIQPQILQDKVPLRPAYVINIWIPSHDGRILNSSKNLHRDQKTRLAWTNMVWQAKTPGVSSSLGLQLKESSKPAISWSWGSFRLIIFVSSEEAFQKITSIFSVGVDTLIRPLLRALSFVAKEDALMTTLSLNVFTISKPAQQAHVMFLLSITHVLQTNVQNIKLENQKTFLQYPLTISVTICCVFVTGSYVGVCSYHCN